MLHFSAHLGYLFTEKPFVSRFAAARQAGFAIVECPVPYSIPVAQMRSILDGEGLQLVQFALPTNDSEKGCAAIPGREQEFLASLAAGLEYAIAVGARFIHVQAGLVPAGVEFSRLWDTYIRNLAKAADQAAQCGLKILIEPITAASVANYFVNSSDLALRAVKQVAKPNVSVLFDVFHATSAGEDAGRFVVEHVADIGHLHIADHPGRHEPGTGKIDYSSLFAMIEGSGFHGVIGCEYKPTGKTEDSFAWAKPWFETKR